MFNLSNKVAIITGANTGIGYAMALGFARAGAAVLAHYYGDPRGADDAVAQIRADGGRAIALAGDIRRVADCRAMVERCVAEFGRVDIACCHAGITSWGQFLDYTEDAFDHVVDTNLKGTYFCAQAAARAMVRQGSGGRIVLTSSVVGNQAVQNLSAYAMTKAGLQMLARNLVLELSPHGITINALAVGPIVNERNLADDPQYAEKWAGVVPLRRAGYPQDVVEAALFLASDEASFINGTTLTVDGGWTAYSPTPDFEFVERANP
ncbi:MAG: SDR family oxidoreductase [Chloroflexota bacterium]